ncbi:hypothetical protein SDC9_212044 [bioreactor metagenome]|uniref:Uncharacterized protein n=1 Tax=bioreactor metagenome TaxID=1076179 RepID=A0A645JZ01_9ZZZZ
MERHRLRGHEESGHAHIRKSYDPQYVVHGEVVVRLDGGILPNPQSTHVHHGAESGCKYPGKGIPLVEECRQKHQKHGIGHKVRRLRFHYGPCQYADEYAHGQHREGVRDDPLGLVLLPSPVLAHQDGPRHDKREN